MKISLYFLQARYIVTYFGTTDKTLNASAEIMSDIHIAAGVLRDEFGALAEKMTKHTAVLDWRSRSLELIDD